MHGVINTMYTPFRLPGPDGLGIQSYLFARLGDSSSPTGLRIKETLTWFSISTVFTCIKLDKSCQDNLAFRLEDLLAQADCRHYCTPGSAMSTTSHSHRVTWEAHRQVAICLCLHAALRPQKLEGPPAICLWCFTSTEAIRTICLWCFTSTETIRTICPPKDRLL